MQCNDGQKVSDLKSHVQLISRDAELLYFHTPALLFRPLSCSYGYHEHVSTLGWLSPILLTVRSGQLWKPPKKPAHSVPQQYSTHLLLSSCRALREARQRSGVTFIAMRADWTSVRSCWLAACMAV